MNKLKHLISSIMHCADEDEPVFEGHRNVTPSFQVLLRQSSNRFHKRRYRCVLFPLILLFIFVLTGSLLFVYVLDDVFQDGQVTNSKLPPLENITNSVLGFIGLNATNSQQCPFNVTGVGTYNSITALLGGYNEHEVELTSIELFPSYNCSSSVPRLVMTFF